MCNINRINRAENVRWSQLRAIRKARIFTIAVHECSRNYIIQSHPAAKLAGVCMHAVITSEYSREQKRQWL